MDATNRRADFAAAAPWPDPDRRVVEAARVAHARPDVLHHGLQLRPSAAPTHMSANPDAPLYERRSLFDSDAMRIVQVIARPRSSAIGELEQQTLNVLALPLAGVFARHHGTRARMLATPNHAVFLAAGAPYRVSFPGRIGDLCLMLAFPAQGLARLMPQAIARDAFDATAFEDHALLPPALVLGTRRLHQQLLQDDADVLQTEETALELLAAVLGAARRERSRRRSIGPIDARARLRPVERAKEAITVQPEQRWTLEALADVACVSPYHLAHSFRREVGTSVYQYVLRARLARALDRVVGSDEDLTEVALDAGFSSHSHFTSRFRALYGVTPRALRGARRSGSDTLAA